MARTFNASSSQAVFNNTTPPPISGVNVSQSAWIKVAALPGSLSAIYTYAAIGTFNWLSLLLDTTGKCYANMMASGNNNFALSSNTVSTNVWCHIAGVYTATTIAIYINGVKTVNNGAFAFPVGMTATQAGAQAGVVGPEYFTGTIAECATWNSALSDAQVTALLNGANPTLVQPVWNSGGALKPSLVHYWPLWGISSPEPSLCGNNLNGTLSNAPTSANHAPVGAYCPPTLWTPRAINGQVVSGARHHRLARSWFG